MTEHGVGYKKDCRIIHSITPKLCQKILLVSLNTKPSVSTVASDISCQRCSPLVSHPRAKAKATISTVNHVQPTNLYTIFVGYPGLGKSSAIDHGCIKPIENTLQADVNGCLFDRTTSSGLVKHLSKNGTAFIVSSEVSDVLNKLLKS